MPHFGSHQFRPTRNRGVSQRNRLGSTGFTDGGIGDFVALPDFAIVVNDNKVPVLNGFPFTVALVQDTDRGRKRRIQAGEVDVGGGAIGPGGHRGCRTFRFLGAGRHAQAQSDAQQSRQNFL